MTLHLDILLHICDILAHDHDNESLKSWALVCSHFATICQSHLFARATLLVKAHSRRARRLRKALRANPKLGTYIKELHISFDHAGKTTYANPDIPFILPYCTSVTSFKVETLIAVSYGWPEESGKWPESLPQATLAGLESILYSPALTRLEIGGFSMPSLAEFLSPCSSALTDLDLRGVVSRAGSERPEVRGIEGAPIFPRKLFIGSAMPLSYFLEAKREDGSLIFNLSRLQDLETTCWRAINGQSINTLLFRRAAPLRTLRIHLSSYLTPYDDGWIVSDDLFAWNSFHQSPMAFPCFSTLRIVVATVRIYRPWDSLGDQPVESVLHDITVSLHRFPAENVVENIVFDITICKNLSEQAIPVARDYWLHLATSFATGFSCLKIVDAKVTVVCEMKSEERFVVVENLKRLSFKDLDLPFSFNFSAATQLLN